MTHGSWLVDVPLSGEMIEALLEGAGAAQGALHDAHCALRSAVAHARMRALVVERNGPPPDRRRGADRRAGGSVHVGQMLGGSV